MAVSREAWYGTVVLFVISYYSLVLILKPKKRKHKNSFFASCSPKFLDEIFSIIQRNSQDEVLGVFMIENLVINNFKRE